MTTLTVSGILRRAESLIAGRWSRTGFEPGRYCLIEALGEVSGVDFEHRTFRDAYLALRGEIGEKYLVVWNERPERTEAEVRAALLAAAQRAEVGT